MIKADAETAGDTFEYISAEQPVRVLGERLLPQRQAVLQRIASYPGRKKNGLGTRLFRGELIPCSCGLVLPASALRALSSASRSAVY